MSDNAESRKVLVKYEVISGVVLKDVIRAVNSLIAEGWQPIGGISVRTGEYLQAVVLYDWL